MLEVRERDILQRFPYTQNAITLGGPLEVAHGEHRGMGGNPSLSRTTRKTMLLLSRRRHKEHKFSVDQKSLKWEALTDDGTDGPIRWWIDVERLPEDFRAKWMLMPLDGWLLLATESAPHVWIPFTAEQQAILDLIQ